MMCARHLCYLSHQGFYTDYLGNLPDAMRLWIKNLSVRCRDMLCELDEHGVIV